jgi:hypothetical protein
MAYLLYGHCGGITTVQKFIEDRQNVYPTLLDALKSVADSQLRSFDVKDLSIKYYCYDPRIKKEVFIILTRRFRDEMYTNPQFVSYMVEV